MTATLLVDVGGTLLVRPGGGVLARALDVLVAHDERGAAPGTRAAMADAIQTGRDREAALEAVLEALPWAAGIRAALRRALDQEEAGYELLPGALRMLDAARSAGLRVLACTNMSTWQAPLPPEIAGRLDGVIASCSEQIVKQRSEFWLRLVERGAVDPAVTLVVGDDAVADGSAPASAGICPLVLGGGLSPLDVARWLEALPAPPDGTVAALGGRSSQWGGRRIWPGEHLQRFVERVTRRTLWLCDVDGTACRTVVVRRRERVPAVIVPADVEDGLYWISVRSLQRPARAPADLEAAMAAAGVDDDQLAEHERRHLYAMVREAKDPAVRAGRIDDVLSFLASAREGRVRQR